MLRQIESVPPQSQGCFYDYLVGCKYTCINGQFYHCHPSLGNTKIPFISTTTKQISVDASQYLHQLILVQGSAVINTSCTIATNKINSTCIVRSNKFISNRSCWQWNVPGSLHGVQLGIFQLNNNGSFQYLPFNFNSSTSRTITFLVDNQSIKVWVNDTQPLKNYSKTFDIQRSKCYPYAKLTTKGSSVIFNPFAVQPNTKISRTNPFNSTQINIQQQLKLTPSPIPPITNIKIIDVKQINLNRLLLIADQGFIKIINRNPQNNLIQFNQFYVQDDKVCYLFNCQQWKFILQIFKNVTLPQIQWQHKCYKLEQVLNLLRFLIIKSDELQQIHTSTKYHEVKYLLLSKLSIIRPYIHQKIPNSISICEIDRMQYNYSQQFLNQQNTTPIRIIPVQTITNTLPWFKLNGQLIATSQHFICCYQRNISNQKQQNIILYQIYDYGIKKIFIAKLLGNKLQFNKNKMIQNSLDDQINLWKQNNRGSEIYKILSNCFTHQNYYDMNIFEIKQKDIKELVQIFKISKEDAITALEQTGDVQDALAWLADTNRKVYRKKKNQNGQKNQDVNDSHKINCSLIELPQSYLITKILLQLYNSVYIIGFNPHTFASRYVQKTQKGYLSLSSLQYGANLSQIKSLNCYNGLNLAQLSILDELTLIHNIQNGLPQILFIYNDKAKIYIAIKKNDKIYRQQIQLYEQNIYKQICALKFNEKLQKISLQEDIKQNNIFITIHGQIFIRNQKNNNEYKNNSIIIQNGNVFTNINLVPNQQLSSIAQIWVRFNHVPQLTFTQTQEIQPKFLPLLVQRGPPGCNMNYPICSILYPKPSLPFLANYPYSLTFKHLHSKCMKVSEVIIQRIGQKHNTNEIKQGSIYFIDDGNIQSKRYNFKFVTQNELIVKVNQQNYWRYMVIQPTYNSGNKLPYQIGFMGAKGTSIQLQQYQTSITNKIQQILDVSDHIGKRRFDVIKINALSHSIYKVFILLHSNDAQNNVVGSKDEINFISKCKEQISVIMVNRKYGINQFQNEGKQSQQFVIKSHQLASMNPSQLIKILKKSSKQQKDKKQTQIGKILKQILKNELITLKNYNQSQIKILIDIFISGNQLSIKQFQHLYFKIYKQNYIGSQYLHELIFNIGKANFITIEPKYMPFILNVITSQENVKHSEEILRDLILNVKKLKNQHYNTLHKLYSPYLIFETDYYSQYYYNQVKFIEQGSNVGQKYDKIYKEQIILNYKFVVFRGSGMRKIIVKFNQKSLIKNILLRFDKSETHNKASINIYSWNGNKKQLCSQCLIYQHQWIQISKNPYRKQMINMFSNNHSWLNAFGICLQNRIEVSYLQFQILFNLNGVQPSNQMGQATTQILPQIYGIKSGVPDIANELQQTYFKYNEQQRIFLSKTFLKMQINCDLKYKQPQCLFNKYLINKQNEIQYQMFENTQYINNDNKLQHDQQSIQFKTDLDNIIKLSNQFNKKDIQTIFDKYHSIMKNLTLQCNHIRITRKICLDYCYTLIMWILEQLSKKQIVVSQQTAKLLLSSIVKHCHGPILYSCFKAISQYPDLLIDGLSYVHISGQGQKILHTIPSSILKGNISFKVTQANIKKVLQLKDSKLAQSLINIIIDTKQINQQSIHQCIILANLSHKHQKIIHYILQFYQQFVQNQKQDITVFQSSKISHTINQQIIQYIYNKQVTIKQRNQLFIQKLNSFQLQRLILQSRKISNSKQNMNINFNYLLQKLFNDKKIGQININVVSLIFQLNLDEDQQWYFLQKCIKYCPAAQDMIQIQYLSRQQKPQLVQLATFHRDILFSAAKHKKNSQLLVNFLSQIFEHNKKLFLQIITSFPQTQICQFHPDINIIIFKILNQQCNFGGIQGVKCTTFQQNIWLCIVVKLIKLSSNKYDQKSYSSHQIENIVKWYFLNNQYQQHMSNPITRSPAVNNITFIAEKIKDIIGKVGGASNINRIFQMHSEIKEQIKKDSKRLLNSKHLMLKRLQFGVLKLMQNNLYSDNLLQVLVGKSGNKGLIEQIIKQLQEQEKRQQNKTTKSSVISKQIDLADQLQVYNLQNTLINIPCKDVSSYKIGLKLHAFAIPITCKRLILKPTDYVNMSKFIIAFIVNQNSQKNNILPDSVQLYGGKIDQINDVMSTTMKKICDLYVIQDQQYTQFGIKIFGMNFACIKRQYRNNVFNVLQIRAKSVVLPSISDLLQCNQKVNKNLMYHVSFIAIHGHKQYVQSQLSFSDVYMKMLTFLSTAGFQSALKQFIKYIQKNEVIFKKFIQLLNIKTLKNTNNDKDKQIQNLLIALSYNNVPILQYLIKQKQINYELVYKILKTNLNTHNIDLVVQNALQKMNEQFIDKLIQLIKLNSLISTSKSKKIKQNQIITICQRYFKLMKLQYNQQNKQILQIQIKLIKKLLATITTSPTIYHFNPTQLAQKLFQSQDQTIYYPIIASFVPYYNETLKMILTTNKIDKLSTDLLKKMSEYNKTKKKKTQIQISNIICLISSLSIYPQIKQILILNQKNQTKLPIQIFKLLTNQQTLIQQYPNYILKNFISLFQSTCSTISNIIDNTCSEQFVIKLIQVMTKLSQTQSNYHNYFIHDFFFPIINAYSGVLVSYLWKGQNKNYQYLLKPTQILKTQPIRKNETMIQFQSKYYKQIISSKDYQDKNINRILVFNKKVIAQKNKNQQWWKFITYLQQPQHQIKQIQDKNQIIKLTMTNGQIKSVTMTQADSIFKCYAQDPNIVNELNKLLTNQILLRGHHQNLFAQNYSTSIPFALGMHPYTYLMPAQMTIGQMLKQINIYGYHLNQQTRQNIKIYLNSDNKQLVPHQQKFINLFNKVSKIRPIIQLQIFANELFQFTTVQKISKQNQQIQQRTKFIPQQTIFKSFQKLQGLQKMIKVIMVCVKNWNNSQQSKIWSQYLSQLSSFSCFPIFSSIYMNRQQNVQLLFKLLLGLPDKQDRLLWLKQQKKSVKSLYDIIKNVFQVQGKQAIKIRQYAVKSDFYETMLQRLHLITKQLKRYKAQQQADQQLAPQLLTKKTNQQQQKKMIKKKKGVGYGNDSSSNQKWDITGHQEAKKQQSQQIISLIKILSKFLSHSNFQFPANYLNATYASALLPILQNNLRAGSLLQISKNAQLFKQQLKIIKVLAKNSILIPTLMDIPKIYQPKQPQSILSLLTTLQGTSKIFLSCLNKQISQKTSQQIAKNIIQTYNEVQQAISNYKIQHVDQNQDKKILQLPLNKKYPMLMKDLRFDYIDMKDKSGKIKHHFSSHFQAKYTPSPTKAIRLAQQLADLSHALPMQHTNAIYVRCDKNRVDFMQALIMGSNGTPYGHGAYLFDIYFDDSYPNNPPKVNMTTTGYSSIRFNPNLYICGKVCLSLLGTWRGTAMQNWDPKVSTLLQVLVSIQSIIMAQQIYFNQPGFQHQQGTVQGQMKNQGYSNIVRYGNIKYAMVDNLKNPPKGFQTVIRRHFYLKKQQILKQCSKWLKFAEKREASYSGLVSDHNRNLSNSFKKSKTQYHTMLQKVIKQLQEQLNKLPQPSAKDLIRQKGSKSPKKQKKQKKQKQIEGQKDDNLQQIDVTYEVKGVSEIARNYKQLDVNDEKVKDRWSRYIGAMGLQAVNKQSKASILLFGLSSLGIQIAKNIVLSGCKRFSVRDNQVTSWKDLAGQFYLTQQDIGKSRVDSCLYKLQDLNNYVRVDSINIDLTKQQQLNKLKQYQVVISTIHNQDQLIKLNHFCRTNDIKFIIALCQGPYGFVFNDFGKLQVLDKNGQQPVQCFISDITHAEQGRVTLMQGQKLPYEVGDVVKISNVKGMISKTDMTASINQTLHKIVQIGKNCFKIGNTLQYSEYVGNGLVKNIKIPIQITFKSFEQSLKIFNIDQNLQFYDFAKSQNNQILHRCFRALSLYKIKHQNKYPRSWNWDDSQEMIQIYKAIPKKNNTQQKDISELQKKYVQKFSFTCSGSFAPLAAFYGGVVAQEAFKAITNKYMPINQFFLTDFTQIIDDLPEDITKWKQVVENKKYKAQENRFDGLRCIVGDETLQKIRDCKVFIVGSGAIGCQLLKNYAMINIATSEKQNKGSIVVTDPDHIQISNLNRQFLFREKHLRKPKSATAAAVVKQMNRYLKGQNKIRAKHIKVCQATKDTFSNQFFQSMDIVTNALDNVQARQYIDMRCVENKVALIESGTLSTKGHVQVIIPYKTQTYGSKPDPAQEGDIPQCTLKMFPQETLHCVEWARDIFGKMFTIKPKTLAKIMKSINQYTPAQSQSSIYKQSLHMLQQKPNNFDDAILVATKQFYKLYKNDIKQLLYTYPLDAKTKDGKDFWKLPRRPPTPIQQIDSQVKLHGQFITSYAVLLCKIYKIPFPKDFRSQERRQQIVIDASKIKPSPFIPSDKIAKQMQTEVQQNDKQSFKMQQQQAEITYQGNGNEDFMQLFNKIKVTLKKQSQHGNPIQVQPQQFQKDDDSNGHIDLIYSMSNLRALNYSLQPMDWITTKLKAGRIIPALSTTTSCIAALQTIQLIKYLKKLPIQKMKNTFLNLAIPIIQAGEPGEVQKIKIHENLITNIWQRWTLDKIDFNDITMGSIIKKIQQKFKISIKILNITCGGPIYSDLVLGLESKKQQKQQFMSRKFKDVISEQVAIEDLKNYVDLTLVMAVGEQFIKHVPTLRVNFKN